MIDLVVRTNCLHFNYCRIKFNKKKEQDTTLWYDANAGISWIINGHGRHLQQLINCVLGEAVAMGVGRGGRVCVQMEAEVMAPSSTLHTHLYHKEVK